MPTCSVKGKAVENVVKLLNTDKVNSNGTLIGEYQAHAEYKEILVYDIGKLKYHIISQIINGI